MLAYSVAHHAQMVKKCPLAGAPGRVDIDRSLTDFRKHHNLSSLPHGSAIEMEKMGE